jgi:hypothetical protein
MNLYLQNIVENFNPNNVPADWLGIDFYRFIANNTKRPSRNEEVVCREEML